MPLFRIIPEEQTVEPCVVEGRKVVVNLPQLGPQEVTPSGGMIIPGNIFSRRDTHFRISYAVDDTTLKRGLDVLRQLANLPGTPNCPG